MNTQALLKVAHVLADAARDVILPYFRAQNLSAENKDQQGYDPVTQADKAAEREMRRLLQELRPQDAILGEEFGHETGRSGYTWVLDPIDGTRGFISGTPTWGVLIAVRDAKGPFLGLVDQPYIGERFVGTPQGATVITDNGTRAIQTRGARPLSQATLFSTFPEVGTAQERAAFTAVSEQVQLTRFGMDCYAYALLAMGQIDLVIEAGLNAYDIQSPIALIQGAGGIVSDWTGQPAHEGGRVLAAANQEIHAQALKILKDMT